MMTIDAASSPAIATGDQTEERPEGARRTRAALWLTAAAVISLLLPIYRVSRLALGEAARLEGQAARLAATVTAKANDPAIAALQQELSAARTISESLQGVRQAVAVRYVDWAAVLGAVGQYDPAHLALTSLAQEGTRLKVQGTASDDTAVVAYVDRLEASGLFIRVSVESIESVGGTPLPAVALRTPSPAPAATSTPQPSARPTSPALLGDAYEPTDDVGSLMVPGATQVRTFHVPGDVDRARLVAKAGRTYRAYTDALQVGVDTTVTVHVGWMVLTNDDQRAGVLASEVIFTTPAGPDVEAIIEVTNRGVAGDQQHYSLVLAEIVPTPTPTGVPPTAAPPQATPASTATLVPTVAATPTFDLRDPFEPDDDPQVFIAVGEVQMRSFHPVDDVDRVLLAAQPGHVYRVTTFGLAPDVDTFLAVRANGTVYVNDDKTPGEAASEVSFEVLPGNVDPAIIEVTNRGRYGPAQWYRLALEELTPTVTPTPTEMPTSTPTPSPTLSAALSGPSNGQGYGRWFAVQPLARALHAARVQPAAIAYPEALALAEPRVRFVLILEIGAR